MKILGVSGKKQSGKNTTANIIHGIVLKERNLVKDWNIGPCGELMILTDDSMGKEGWGEFDVSRKDSEFVSYAEYNMWPFVKLYSFADQLKWICTEIFAIPHRCVWGTDSDKNQMQEHLRWENMPGVYTDKLAFQFCECDPEWYNWQYHAAGPMTAREFMQFFGSEIMRKIWEPVWVQSTLNQIKKEQPLLAIIADVRFPNEASAIEDTGGTVLRLTRKLSNDDNHLSETSLDDYSFKHILDNADISIDSFCQDVVKFYQQNIR